MLIGLGELLSRLGGLVTGPHGGISDRPPGGCCLLIAGVKGALVVTTVTTIA